MNHSKQKGQENRAKIIEYLKTVLSADVKTITIETGMKNRETVYAHCHNLTREGILKERFQEIPNIKDRMVAIYSIKHH